MKKSNDMDDSIKSLDEIVPDRVPLLPRIVDEYLREVGKHWTAKRWPNIRRDTFVDAVIAQCQKKFGVTPTYHQVRDRLRVRRT